MELLERVIAEYYGADALGDLQNERITATNGAGGRCDDLPGDLGLLEARSLRHRDAVFKAGVHYNDHVGTGVLLEKRTNRVVELDKTRDGPTFSCEVRAVDDDAQ
jgi:hypothetical protein